MEFLIGVVVSVLIYSCIIIPIFTLSSILNGYVLSVLWGWFMVPIFHLPSLSLAQAIGVSIVVGMLTRKTAANGNKDEDMKKLFKELVIESLLYPVLVLAIGAVVHQFI